MNDGVLCCDVHLNLFNVLKIVMEATKGFKFGGFMD